MTIRFTTRHMSGGTAHQHIASLRWIEDGASDTKESTRGVLVDWVKEGGQGYVKDSSGNKAWVHVVEANSPYIQTHSDGIWTDNLLALPEY